MEILTSIAGAISIICLSLTILAVAIHTHPFSIHFEKKDKGE